MNEKIKFLTVMLSFNKCDSYICYGIKPNLNKEDNYNSSIFWVSIYGWEEFYCNKTYQLIYDDNEADIQKKTIWWRKEIQLR